MNSRCFRTLALAVSLLGCASGYGQSLTQSDPLLNSVTSSGKEKMLGAPIPVVGVHHYGRGHHIGEFSIDGRTCGNAGTPEKNSGSDTMCRVSLPTQWRPGIKFKVQWGLTNWNDDLTALQHGNAGHWYEAEAEVERYSDHRGLEVHFWPDNSIRLVADPYGPPDSDTRADQTPPLAELPVYPPGWYGLGGLRAIYKYEGKYGDDLQKFEAHRQSYHAFLLRLWTSRGLTAQQIADLMAQEKDKERRGIVAGYSSYLDGVMRRAGYTKEDIKARTKGWPQWSLDEFDQQISSYLVQIKNP